MSNLAQFVATVAYVGHLKPAPGTWGSLAALPLAYFLHVIGGTAALAAGIVVFFFLGLWATPKVTDGKDNHDPSEVVVDELVGQWIALLPVSIGALHSGATLLALWPGWIAAFVLFRLFDILKPGPVGWADRSDDAMGVMLDDVVAGVFAAIGVGILAWLAHGVLGV
jgi:phosphatidylglycerophosphatase A